MSTFLTKSRIKQALECPTKLYYASKPEIYGNASNNDEFLQALADGGHQVGELAKLIWPGGIEVSERNNQNALKETNEFLNADDVILYEPAISYQNFLVRVDVLVKKNGILNLYEVKAKSFDNTYDWFNKDGSIKPSWMSYLYDVAFQKYVLKKAFPGSTIHGYVVLCDKNHNTQVDGLYRNFEIHKSCGSTLIQVQDSQHIDPNLLNAQNIDDIIEQIWEQKHTIGSKEYNWEDYLEKLSQAYSNQDKITTDLKSICKTCEYRLDKAVVDGSVSGFHECWKANGRLTDDDLNNPLILDLWSYQNKNNRIEEGVLRLEDMDPAILGDINPDPKKTGLQTKERQELQIIKVKSKDGSLYVDKEGLREVMAKVEYPLHMIDFETTAPAIPFHKGTRPYEQIAFQFSHHIIGKEGNVTHANEWINHDPQQFPNFQFVRELKKAVGEKGSVFRYSYHENTILGKIWDQLNASSESDRAELMEWIKTITHRDKKKGRKDNWRGYRDMIDLCDWVKRFYYDPYTMGSNSLKVILPSILKNSHYLKLKYAKPIYGSSEMASLNFKSKSWIINDNFGEMINPYKQLPGINIGELKTRDELDDLYMDHEELDDGGAAMTAYNYMQFRGMKHEERKAILKALLQYCELDTLAMVMLWEGLSDLLN